MRSTRSLLGIPISLANSYTRMRGPATACASPPPEDSDLRSNPLPIMLFHSRPGRKWELGDDSNRVASQNKCGDGRQVVHRTPPAKSPQEAAVRQRGLHARLVTSER